MALLAFRCGQALKRLSPSSPAPPKMLAHTCVEDRVHAWLLILRRHACVTCTGLVILASRLSSVYRP
ncbi:hypothetical protein C2E21_8889 [Chlorella sorokiniana]|uniref:Uncharacterized protein n=1 Tax=Chlorella sorokiniana TaxID=3076 RepID=A0A2P6TD68_CHLSO|nr:hypothetical protein C2E21_8889 [Chlorella sorokiniana]|eukprot:PRW20586.1 hypothetical protein C2E21_8889 [Chlorella sorokiniana]